jgi:hypothetical protein
MVRKFLKNKVDNSTVGVNKCQHLKTKNPEIFIFGVLENKLCSLSLTCQNPQYHTQSQNLDVSMSIHLVVVNAFAFWICLSIS